MRWRYNKQGDHPKTIALFFVVKTQTCKPGSVFRTKPEPLSFIYPGNHLPDQAAYPSRLPKNQNGPFCIPAYQKIMIYLALQLVRGTAGDVATATGELLPHLFTRSRLRCIKTRWSFSVTLLQAFTRLPVKKHDALCCPDFPPRLLGAIERSARQRWENSLKLRV